MGCTNEQSKYCISDEKQATLVELHDFWIGKYEVTNAQYAEFLSQVGNQKEGGALWYQMDKYALIKKNANGLFVVKKGVENHPVANVSWYGARAYADWLSKKPTKTTDYPPKQNGNMQHGVDKKTKDIFIVAAIPLKRWLGLLSMPKTPKLGGNFGMMQAHIRQGKKHLTNWVFMI